MSCPAPGGKSIGSLSRVRYSKYSSLTTLAAYHLANAGDKCNAGLYNDLRKGLCLIFPAAMDIASVVKLDSQAVGTVSRAWSFVPVTSLAHTSHIIEKVLAYTLLLQSYSPFLQSYSQFLQVLLEVSTVTHEV